MTALSRDQLDRLEELLARTPSGCHASVYRDDLENLVAQARENEMLRETIGEAEAMLRGPLASWHELNVADVLAAAREPATKETT